MEVGSKEGSPNASGGSGACWGGYLIWMTLIVGENAWGSEVLNGDVGIGLAEGRYGDLVHLLEGDSGTARPWVRVRPVVVR